MKPPISRVRRPFPWIWSCLALLILAAPAVLAAAEGAAPAWPAKVTVVKARIAKIAIPEGHADTDFPVPQLRVYDKEGRRVLERLGYYAPTFSAFLTRALSGGLPGDPTHLLAHELDLVVTPEGQPIPSVPEADYTLVDYWASWCAPCRAQDQDLIKVLASKPDLRINLVRVEADLSQKKPEEIARMIQAARDAAAARNKSQG
jgi:thiol-disulfide isomerase/thioredoxin